MAGWLDSCVPCRAGSEMAAPTLAYSTALFATFYDAMVASLPAEFEVSDHGGLVIWHMRNGYWKQTLDKTVERLDDGGMAGTETFKIGCKDWSNGSMVCSWTLRAVWWVDIRDLCEEVGLVIQHEFRSFGDALCGRNANLAETGDGGRIFVIQRQS